MSKVKMWRLFLKGLTLVILVGGLFLFSQKSIEKLASSNAQQGPAGSPVISIAPQEESPLRIISTSVESAEAQAFKLRLNVQNQSSNKIRAYAVAFETVTNEIQNARAEFLNLTQPSTIWQPTEIRAIELKDNQNEPLVRITLAIDFVEFSDGSTWGPDLHNSRDILMGQRAGAKLERQRLRQLLKSKGQAAVNEALQGEIPADLSDIAERTAPRSG